MRQHITGDEKRSTVSGAPCLPGNWSFLTEKHAAAATIHSDILSVIRKPLSLLLSSVLSNSCQPNKHPAVIEHEGGGKSLTSKLLPFIGISLCPADTKEINKYSSVLHQVSPASHCVQQPALSCLHWNGKSASQKELYENQVHLHMFGRHECCSRASFWQEKKSSLYSKALALNAAS